MKKRKATVLDVMPVQQSSRYASSAQIDREEAAIERARAIALQDAQRAELREANDARVKEFYSQPGSEIMTHPVPMEDKYSGLEPGAGDEEPDCGQRFLAENPNLNTDALQTIGRHFEGCVKRGAGLTLSNLYRSMERLQDLGVFQKPAQEPAPTKAPSFDSLLQEKGTDSPEVRRALHSQCIEVEFHRAFQEHFDWMVKTFDYACPEHVLAAFWREFKNHGLSPLSGKAWTSIRLKLLEDGAIPAHCQLLSERLASDFRKGKIDDYTYRRNVRIATESGEISKPVAAVA
jgi:hypothetical protein